MALLNMVLKSLVLCAVLTGTAIALPVHDDLSVGGPYSGYQVLEVRFQDRDNVGALLQEMEMLYQVDVWGRPTHGVFDVMVDPSRREDVINFLQQLGASYTVKFPDVQQLLEDHMVEARQRRKRRAVSPDLPTVERHYLRYGQIRQYLNNVRDHATVADVTISSLGRTFERRFTPYVTIREKNARDLRKKVVIIEAGIHAREWIAPSMALNMIYRLAFNPYNDTDVPQLLQRFDWIIIPVMNPDGYVFSHKNASTRLWRKTRTTLYSNDPHCIGVDGNRNFGYEWSDSPYQGGNRNPCTDNFSGPSGFSEPETQNLRTLLLRLRHRAALYLSMHSYGQFFLYPWGYDASATLEDEHDMVDVAQRFSSIMMERNRYYVVGSAAKVLYAAAGASDDYAKGGAGIKFAFTVELSPSDASPHGFLLPPQHIQSVVNDHWPAFKSLAFAVWNKLNSTAAGPLINSVHTRSIDNVRHVNIISNNNDQDDDPNNHNNNNNNNSSNNNNNNNNNNNDDDNDINTGSHDVDNFDSNDGGDEEDIDNNDNNVVSNDDTGAQEGRTRGRGSRRRGRSQPRITEVTIDGHIFRLDQDRSILEWLQYYEDFFNYRRRSRISNRNAIDSEGESTTPQR